MNSKIKACLPYAVYGLVSLAVLGSLLKPGYILSLDLVFGPNPRYTDYFWGLSQWPASVDAANAAALWFFLAIQGASRIVPAWLIEKAILFAVLFLAGLGMHRLAGGKGWGAYFAGLLYMINPFTYTRFLAGQWGVLWAYALTPFAISAFAELLDKKDGRSIIKVAFISTLVIMLYVPWLAMLFLGFLIILAVRVVGEGKSLRAGKLAMSLALSAGLFIVLNFYWLLPLLTSGATLQSQIGQPDFSFFAPTQYSRFGVVFDVAAMYGFWRHAYTIALDIFPFWWLIFLLVLLLAAYGLFAGLRSKDKKWTAMSFGLLAAVSLPLALGASTPVTGPIFEWAWQHIPPFRAFRDSQKLVGLICLSYAYLGALGINALSDIIGQNWGRLRRVGATALAALALLLPPAYSFTMFDFHGQLGVTAYPSEWYEVNAYLNQDKGDFNVLFLPWHMYMDYSWLPNADKRLINPAKQFFDKPIIAGDNLEIPGTPSQSADPVSKYIDFLDANGASEDNLGGLLAPANVKYVILVDEANYQRYDYLYRQKDLTVGLERPGITVFKNQHPTARVYAVDGLVHVATLEEYLRLSHSQDPTDYLYLLGAGPTDSASTPGAAVDSAAKGPLDYQVGSTPLKYTIFVVPQGVTNQHWEIAGQAPVGENLGFGAAFASSADGGRITNARFYLAYLPGYVITAAGLVLMGYFYWFHRERRGVSS